MMNSIEKNTNLKQLCSQCGLCFDICPKNAIEMKHNSFGYANPNVNKEKCINCGLCSIKCPKINFEQEKLEYRGVFAYRSTSNEHSASGGFVYDLAKHHIESGYVVYANIFADDFVSKHVRITEVSELIKIKSSRYVKSDISEIYALIRDDISKGNKVLVIGMPCELLAIKKTFGNNQIKYCALCCGGAVSQLYFNEYLKYLRSTGIDPVSINFRSKKYYPVSYCTEVVLKNGKVKILNGLKNSYVYLTGSKYMMPSCSNCSLVAEVSFDYLVGDCHLPDFSRSTLVAAKDCSESILKGSNAKKIDTNNSMLEHFVFKKNYELLGEKEHEIFYQELTKNYKKAMKKYVISQLSFKKKLLFYAPYFIKKCYMKIKL